MTCLTVTCAKADRLPRLAAGIAAFARQSWADRRLVVAIDGSAGGEAAAVCGLLAAVPGARLLTPPPG